MIIVSFSVWFAFTIYVRYSHGGLVCSGKYLDDTEDEVDGYAL